MIMFAENFIHTLHIFVKNFFARAFTDGLPFWEILSRIFTKYRWITKK